MEEIRGTIQLDANISNARKGIEQLAQTFQNMGGEKGNSFLNTLTQIEKEIDKLENKSGSSVTKIGDFTPAEKSTEKISLLLKKLQKDIGDVDALSKTGKTKLFPPDVANNIKNAADAIKVYTNSMKASESKSGAIGKATAEYNKQTREVENLSQKMAELENKRKSGTTVDQSGFNNQKKLVTDLTQQYDSLIAKVENAKRARDEYAATGGKGGGALKNPSASKPYQNLDADYQEALKQAEEVKIKADEARQAFNNMYIPSELEQELEQTSSKLEQAKIKAEEMKTNLADVRATAMNKSLEEAKEKLKGIADIDLNSITSMEDLERVIEQLTEKGFQELETATNSAKQGINGLAQENDKMNSSLRESKSELQEQNRALEDINGLKSRIQYFFSLTNTAMLARRAIQQAFETVKELDAAMTETAVVTDFSIGDMWEKLPEYTKMANELGVSTKGVYEASTLYYQQGLQTEEVMALTNETLKMARIAGLECADATNLMTAALRGFNMEIDETNSKRINDVYSELAAITAADTEEIATAMTKTASIAYSANMEFETTAALLSQIIETTREPAETAGTALKTIIARFTEMKKASSDIIDIDGETVSVNKVDAALASVGVSLKNAKGEFRDLDDVFLELSSKWNSLDVMSQRYIATMAAGSRQQSRFIAMMQDYDRTIELVNAAYGSSGSSSEQFEKTQDSLESKLERLHNAWNTFLMGIADDSIIKTVIDLLAKLLEAYNKITEKADGLFGSIVRLGTAFAGLKMVGRIVDGIAAHFIHWQKSVNGVGEASKKLTLYQRFLQKMNNFTLDKSLRLNAAIDTRQAETKLSSLEFKTAQLRAAMTGVPFTIDPTNTLLSFETIEGKLAATRATSMLTSQSMEIGLSQVGNQILIDSNLIQKMGKDGQMASLSLGEAANLLRLKYAAIGEKIKEIQGRLAMGTINPTVGNNYIGILQDRQRLIGGDLEGLERFAFPSSSLSETISLRMEGATKKIKDFAATVKDKGLGRAAKKSFGGITKNLKDVGVESLKAGAAVVKGLVKGFVALGPVAWGVTAAIVAITTAIIVMKKNSALADTQRMAELTSELTQQQTEKVTALKEEISALKETWDNMKSVEGTLSELAVGTNEWKNTISEANDEIRELLNNYPELYKFVQVGTNGLWTLSGSSDGQTYKDYLEQQKADLSKAELTQLYRQAYSEAWETRASVMEEISNGNGIVDWWHLTTEGYEKALTFATGVSADTLNNPDALAKIVESRNKEKLNALKYFKTKEQIQNQFSAMTDTYIASYANQAGFSETVTKGMQEVFSDSFQEIEDGIREESGFDGGTTGEGIYFHPVKATINGQERTLSNMSDIADWYLANGYEYVDGKLKSRRILKNTATGEFINLDAVGQGGANGYTTIEINGQKENVRVVSDEEAIYEIETAEAERRLQEGLNNLGKALSGASDVTQELFAGNWQNIDDGVLAALAEESSQASKTAANSLLSSDFSTKIGDVTDKGDIQLIENLTGQKWEDYQEQHSDSTVGDIVAGEIQKKAQELKKVTDQEKIKVFGSLLDKEKAPGFSAEDTYFIKKMDSILIETYGNITGEAISKEIKSAYTKQEASDRESLRKVYEQVDFTSPIQAYSDFLKVISEGTPGEVSIAENALKAFSENILSVSNQFKEVLNSEDFAEVSSNLESIYRTKGEITFDDIQEAATSSSTLNTMLENGVISATGFAKAMELVADGTLSVNDLTDELLKSLTAVNAMMDNLDTAYKRAKKYDFGKNYSEIGASYKDAAAAVKELAESGAWGNPQFDTYMNYLFGEEGWANALEASNGSTKGAYQTLESQINNMQGTLLNRWQALISGKDLEWVSSSNGHLLFNLENISSTEQLVEKVKNDLEVSEEYAQALVADAVNFSDALGEALTKLDAAKAISIRMSNRNVPYISEKELEQLGLTEDDVKDLTINGKPVEVKDTDSLKESFKNSLSFSGLQSNTKEITTDLQQQFNKAVNDGIKQGLSLEDAQLAVLEKMGEYFEAGSKEAIEAGLRAGYQSEEVQYAAIKSAAQQGQELYTTIYTAIVSAIADAYSATTGDLSSAIGASYDRWGKWKQSDTVTWKKDKKGNYTKIEKVDGKEIKTSYTAEEAAKLQNMQSAKNSAYSTASNNATTIFSMGAAAEALGYAEKGKGEDFVKNLENTLSNGGNGNSDTNTAQKILLELKELISAYKDAGTGETKDGDSTDTTEVEKRNYASENSDKQLEALERVRETNDREAELIDKLPEEIQYPLKMMNMAEDIASEYQEIQINKNKLAALEQERAIADAQAIEEGMLGAMGSDLPIYYDEALGSYMWNVEAMNDLSDEQREKAHETMDELSELNSSIEEVKQELDGGKIQKIFHTAGNASKSLSKAFKDTEGKTDDLGEAFEEIGKKYGLGDQFKALGQKIEGVIDSSEKLDKEFEGLGIVSEETLSKLDSLPIGEDTKNLIKNTFGTNQGGTVGSWTGDLLGAGGEMLTGIGDVLNFDMMSMGLDMFNQTKDMASQMIQYVVQFVQTIVSWWTNREDWLYNLLSAIEQEVRNFNRQGEVEERFRLYSDEGLEELVSAWKAMRVSLEKQIDLNEQLIQSRQAELQFLNLTNLPFSPAFYYDYEEERVIENPWVYDIYSLLLDIGAMIPEIGGIFSSIKQLMEDNKQRMESAVSEIEDARDEILELEKQQLELRTKYMDDEIELEELVMDAIIEKQQEEIDELTAMNDAIVEGNQKLIDALNEKLELIRQQRENEDREEELGQKERRLAFLRQDTSNANRKEILDLTDELKKERRDYTDELIDQKISALEKQNDEAAEQRQKQIDLMQEQLDYTEKYGLQWTEAQTLIKNGFDSEGRLRVGTDLYNMLMSKEDFTSLGFGSTRQVKQLMDWDVTNIAAAAFRTINDVWEQGFGNFAMSNDVHEQGSLHLWADREIEYRQLPSWLSFLQPAYNSIQDYLWRTGNNIGAFAETAYGSDKNSTSILGKTLIPALENLFGSIKDKYNDYISVDASETGGAEVFPGIIGSTLDSRSRDWGERSIRTLGDGLESIGRSLTDGLTKVAETNTLRASAPSQNIGDMTMNFYINSEDEENGPSIASSIIEAFREGVSNLSIFK